MRLKNEIFASALDWLVAHQLVDGQKSLAEAVGISQNTISRIMTDKVEPSDDTLRRLSAKFGFNMAWLRGIDPHNMFPDVENVEEHKNVDQSDNETITELREHIADLRQQVSDQRQQIADQRQQIADLRQQLEEYRTRSASISGIVRGKNAFELGVAEPLETPHPDR